MNHIKDIQKGDVYFSSSDIGWVVGHSFIVYGPLLRGATTILYEVFLIKKQGKPNTPNPGIFWSLIEKYKVKGNLDQARVSLNMANSNKKMCIEKYGEEIFAENLKNYILQKEYSQQLKNIHSSYYT